MTCQKIKLTELQERLKAIPLGYVDIRVHINKKLKSYLVEFMDIQSLTKECKKSKISLKTE